MTTAISASARHRRPRPRGSSNSTARHARPPRSIILIEDGEVYLRSTAVLRIARRLRAPWKFAAVFLWVPLPIRDAAYRVIAAVRHRLAGESNACEIPPPEIRARLI